MKEVQRLLAEAFELAKKEGVLIHAVKFSLNDVTTHSSNEFHLKRIEVDSTMYKELS